ncbi:hypothetical protein L596_022762 [Steinernema carpocapsae]|uniref:Uncharacterized protein n=1 Tax=Steinernema carpocapsae TaxID=34508 RepID=A0A4U5MMR9_STECR|nr:hypothetical protein L596_022762 [Steinernema carpocapsae]
MHLKQIHLRPPSPTLPKKVSNSAVPPLTTISFMSTEVFEIVLACHQSIPINVVSNCVFYTSALIRSYFG